MDNVSLGPFITVVSVLPSACSTVVGVECILIVSCSQLAGYWKALETPENWRSCDPGFLLVQPCQHQRLAELVLHKHIPGQLQVMAVQLELVEYSEENWPRVLGFLKLDGKIAVTSQ